MLALYHNEMSVCSHKARLCLAEKGLDWESRPVALRDGEQQQDWYLQLNRRAVVPTLIHDDKVIPESNVILEYLEEVFPAPRLAPQDAYGRAMMRIWNKQLDEDIHDSSAAVITFALAYRHQYLERGEAGRQLLERMPNRIKREQRRDVIEKGPASMHFVVAIKRMMQLLDEMEEALAKHPWLVGDAYTLSDVAFSPYLLRLEHLNLLGLLAGHPRVADWYQRCQARPSFTEALRNWENPKFLELMKQRGAEHWPEVQAIVADA